MVTKVIKNFVKNSFEENKQHRMKVEKYFIIIGIIVLVSIVYGLGKKNERESFLENAYIYCGEYSCSIHTKNETYSEIPYQNGYKCLHTPLNPEEEKIEDLWNSLTE